MERKRILQTGRATYIVNIGRHVVRTNIVIKNDNVVMAEEWLQKIREKNMVISLGFEKIRQFDYPAFNVLQICLGPMRCLVFHLTPWERAPQFLIDFFSEEGTNFTFVGIEMNQMAHQLFQQHSIRIRYYRDIPFMTRVVQQQGVRDVIYDLATQFIGVNYVSMKPRYDNQWFIRNHTRNWSWFLNIDKVLQATVETYLTLSTGLRVLHIVDGGARNEVLGIVNRYPRGSAKYYSWTPPPANVLKLSTDGSYKEVRRRDGRHYIRAGCGGLFRDTQGFWCGGFFRRLFVKTSTEAEIAAALEGLMVARNRGFLDVIVETDSTSVARILLNDITAYAPGTMEYDCVRLMKELGFNRRVRWVFRQVNAAADKLAALGAHHNTGELVRLEFPPDDLRVILVKDIYNVGYCRLKEN